MTKRIFDLFVALFLIVLLMLPFAVLLVFLRVKIGSPIFFMQIRPGRGGRPFKMIKLRTMTNDRDDNNVYLPDQLRLTSIGRFLRASSIDELPELWNVIRGEMSLVGPRPLLMDYLPLYSPEQARRHELRPGITGWAQVNGRNAISWSERFALDLWYVDHRTLWLDVRIMWLTVRKVLLRDGISAAGEATMSKFEGDKS